MKRKGILKIFVFVISIFITLMICFCLYINHDFTKNDKNISINNTSENNNSVKFIDDSKTNNDTTNDVLKESNINTNEIIKKSNKTEKTNDSNNNYNKTIVSENDKYIDNIINDFDLENDKDLIYKNKDLFIKYSKVVDANDNLGNGKHYLYKYFKVVVDNKKYLDEDVFFDKLSSLKFVYTGENRSGGTLAQYKINSNEVYVYCTEKKVENVIYHELMHFMDYSINSNISRNVYSYNNKFISEDEYNKLSFAEKNKVNVIDGSIDYDDYGKRFSSFLTEGGAELYSKRYFNNSYCTTYYGPVDMYYILEYIYSDEMMKDVFFGDKSFYELTNGYFDTYEYKDFINAAYRITYNKGNVSSKDYSYILDKLIGLYTYTKSDDWYNDKVFCLLLYNFADLNNEGYKYSIYYDIYKDNYNYYNNLYINYAKNFNKYVETKSYVYPHIIYENNSLYFITFINVDTEDETLVKLLYDINNGNLKEVYRVKKSRLR